MATDTPNRKRFKTVAAPMSNIAPESDAFFARKVAELQEKHHFLKTEADLLRSEGKDPFHVENAMGIVKQRYNDLCAERDAQMTAFNNWLEAGRPDL